MISTVSRLKEKTLNINYWKVCFHDNRLMQFQIHCFPELYFSYGIEAGKKKMNTLIYEEELDGEGIYVHLSENDPFYQKLQLFLDRLGDNHE